MRLHCNLLGKGKLLRSDGSGKIDSQISDSAYIGPGVQLGRNVRVGPGAIVLGPTIIGDNVFIGAGSVLGGPPELVSESQNASWAGEIEHAGVSIGSQAVIREVVIIHQGTHRQTVVGERSWILSNAYVAHDALIHSHVTVSAGVSIGGHSEVHAGANIGMNAAVHQRRIVGAGSMIGMNCPVTADVPPFVKAFGSPLRIQDLNSIALEKAGLNHNQILEYRHLLQASDELSERSLPSWLPSDARVWFALQGLKTAKFAKPFSRSSS